MRARPGCAPRSRSRRPLAELLDKRTQLEAAARAGVPAPWTRWGAAAELEAAAEECPYPVILKPAFSHLGVKALGAKALRCADADELRAALARTGDIELLLQEYVPGGDDQLYTAGLFLCAEGHLAFTGRKLKQHPPGLGIARLAETVDEPGLVPAGIALLAELGYEGVSQVEYKRDERDGSFRLMEANFRPWTWIGLATACGTNLPLAAHRWALGDEDWAEAAAAVGAGRSLRRRSAPEPRRWVWLVPEAAYTLRDLRHGVRPRAAQWRGVRAEAFFARGDAAPLRRALAAALGTRLHRWDAARRQFRRVARVALHAPGRRRQRHRAPGGVAAGRPAQRRRRRAVDRAAGPRRRAGPGAAPGRRDPDVRRHPRGAAPPRRSRARGRGHERRRHGRRARRDAPPPGASERASAASLAATPSATPSASPAAGVGDVRAAELRAACAALGVDDVALWDFDDGAVPAQRERLAGRIREELARLRPDLVVVPFPYDAHPDHVAVALALGEALASGPGGERSGGCRAGAVARPLRLRPHAVQRRLAHPAGAGRGHVGGAAGGGTCLRFARAGDLRDAVVVRPSAPGATYSRDRELRRAVGPELRRRGPRDGEPGTDRPEHDRRGASPRDGGATAAHP